MNPFSIMDLSEIYSEEEYERYLEECDTVANPAPKLECHNFPMIRRSFDFLVYGIKRNDWIRDKSGQYQLTPAGYDKINRLYPFDESLIPSYKDWFSEFVRRIERGQIGA